jgi:ABC-type nickel/cobalt efflux system permease component RcnA
VTPFTADQWLILILVFVLGLLIGMWLMAGNKWKRRYKEEVARREAIEREHKHREATDIAARAQADAHHRPV